MNGPRALDIQGHRGARGLAPENTLPGFARALAIGVTTLEMDCAVTRDGVVVVSHDASLNPDITRGPDGSWLRSPGPAIYSLSYAELERYDVGRLNPESAYARRWPDQEPADGARIPRLGDVFKLVARSGNRLVRFNIETKLSPLAPAETPLPEVFARQLISAVRAAGMAARTAVQSFDWRTLRIVEQEAPEMATVCLTVEKGFMDSIQRDKRSSPWTAGFHVNRHGGSVPRMVKAARGTVWSPPAGELSRGEIAEAQSLGLAVVTWTVNGRADMRRLIEWGVDGIITDYPDRLRAVAAECGLALPAATPVAP